MDNSSNSFKSTKSSKFETRESDSTVIDLLVEPNSTSSSNFNSPMTLSPGMNAANTYSHQSELEGLSIDRHSENIVIEVSNLHHHTTT